MLSSRIFNTPAGWLEPWGPVIEGREAGFASEHLALLPDSFRNATFQDAGHHHGCHCDMWLAQKGWNMTFLNRCRHEKGKEENTLVNRRPRA